VATDKPSHFSVKNMVSLSRNAISHGFFRSLWTCSTLILGVSSAKALTEKADKPIIKDFESHLILLRIAISP
jgi:hypothetical protein